MDYYLYNNHDFDHGISKWNGTKRSVHYHKCEEPRNKRRIKMFRITLLMYAGHKNEPPALAYSVLFSKKKEALFLDV